MASFEWPPSGGGGGGSGTVTSVGLAAPVSLFTVSGSPVTGAGTLTLTFKTQSANTVFAGPTNGAAAVPAFRGLVLADIPTLPYLSTTLGTANGLSVATNTLSLGLSSASTTGALSTTDWNTFNGKQAAGNYITALTGDGTASGPGSVALTLATVNSNVGSFTNASLTVNAKGLVTAASSGTAPVLSLTVATANGFAGSFTGTTTPVLTLTTSVTGIVQGNGTALSAASTTGSGNVVLSTSPTLVTPALGTPSALVLTNATGTPTSIGLANGTGLSLTTGVTGVLPIANGGTNKNAVTVAPLASSWAGWDANSNFSANNSIIGFATTATAAGTTALTVASARQQYFTGTTTQTVTLPTTSIVAGFAFTIANTSTGLVTINASGGAAVIVLPNGFTAQLVAVVATPTLPAGWAYSLSNRSTVSPGNYAWKGVTDSDTGFWSTSSSSYVDFSVSTAPTIVELFNTNFGTVTQQPTTLPGVGFTAPRTGTIKVTINLSVLPGQSGTPINWNFRLLETTTATDMDYQGAATATNVVNNGSSSVVLVGYFPATLGVAYNFAVQGRTSGNTLYISAAGDNDNMFGVAMEYIS